MDIDDMDFIYAQQLQEQFNKEIEDSVLTESSIQKEIESDHILALQLQEEINKEESQDVSQKNGKTSIVDNFWELNDPNPDIHGLFLEFNSCYFWNKLQGIEVQWSSRMTLCAGICCYEGYGGLCSIRLSLPLLKLRPRKDLVETLLHEMIHAYLFVTHSNRDHDAHGPEFLKHMHRINRLTGTNITVYHNFHDEVNEYRQHWWRCNGPCRHRRPYYGFVRRAMNRAPSSNDFWWKEHRISCGGTFEKIKEPEKNNSKRKETETLSGAVKRFKNEFSGIKKYFGSSDENQLVIQPSSYSKSGERAVTYDSPKNIHTIKSSNKVTEITQITPFSGKGHVLGSSQLQNANNVKKKPTLFSYFETSQNIPLKHSSSSNEIKVGKRNGLFMSQEKKQPECVRDSNSVSFKKFLPAGKLSTASPLNHVKKLFTDDGSNDKLDTFWLLSLKTPVKKEESINSGSSFENPVTLNGENSHSDSDVLTNTVICPVCNQKFENSQINTHLDKCLSQCA